MTRSAKTKRPAIDTDGITAKLEGDCVVCGRRAILNPVTMECVDRCPTIPGNVRSAAPHPLAAKLKRDSGIRQVMAQRARARSSAAECLEDLMNGMERSWSYKLETHKLAGVIQCWQFQPARLRISFSKAGKGTDGEGKGLKSAWYTPDFMVVDSDGMILFDEVKGHWEEAAKVRIRVAADLYPMFAFRTIEGKGKRFAVNTVKPA